MNGLIAGTGLIILFIVSIFAQTNVSPHRNMGVQTVSGQKNSTNFRPVKPILDTLNVDKPRVRNYTLLVYMIGSDLDSYAKQDIQEMIDGSQNSKINIVLETGGGTGIEFVNDALSNNNSTYNNKIAIDFTRVQRHVIANGSLSTMDLGKKNMADPFTLSDFIRESELQFPAKKYAIILWDHGSGLNGFGKDLVFNKSSLPIYQLKISFDMANATGTKFEFIGFDACLMASAEIASALQNFSHFLIASQEVEPPWSWDYTTVIKSINSETLQPGNLTGKIIVDSFAAQSKKISSLKLYGLTDKEITLSVIDLQKMPQLTKSLDILADATTGDIVDAQSAINLSKSIESTESYGLSYTANTGLVDIYDLASNMKSRFPDLSRQANDVMNLINDTVVHKYDGEARPNAHGLSIYFPFQGNLLTAGMDWIQRDLASKQFDASWNKLSSYQINLLSADFRAPAIQSVEENQEVKVHVFGSDVSRILAKIVTNSSTGHSSLIYVQSIDPSILDRNGFFSYKGQKMLMLCNKTSCLPVTMKMMNNGDKEFVLIPVRIESEVNHIDKSGSLLYEMNNKGFEFLGLTQEINPDTTISKERLTLESGFKIFVKALPLVPQFTGRGENIGQDLANPSKYVEDGPLLVNDPTEIIPRYITNVSNFSVQFAVCDYANNCDVSRWYDLSHGNKNPISVALPIKLQSGYDVKPKKVISSQATSNFTIYVNPELGFQIQYPSIWNEIKENLYDNTSIPSTFKQDPKILSFRLSNVSWITISADSWPFNDSSEALFDYYNKSSELPLGRVFDALVQFSFSIHFAMISHSHTTISGYPAFEFAINYTLPNSYGKDMKITEDIITILMNGRMYTINWHFPSSEFRNYLPIKDYMLNSFGAFTKHDMSTYSILPSKNVSVIQENLSKALVSTYVDHNDGFSIKYPSNIFRSPVPPLLGIIEDLKLGYKPNGQIILRLINSTYIYDTTKDVDLAISAFFLNQDIMTLSYNQKFGSLTTGDKSLNEDQIMELIRRETIDHGSYSNNWAFLSSGDLMLKPGKGHYFEYRYFNVFDKAPRIQRDTYIINGNQLFKFQFVADPSNYQRYLPIINQILNSFEILPINSITGNGIVDKGVALAKQGKYQEAIAQFDEALAINPNNVNALLHKGVALDNLGRYQEAITYYDKALTIDPRNTILLVDKGNDLDTLGKYQEAITYYDRALAIDPHNARALKLKGDTLGRLGR